MNKQTSLRVKPINIRLMCQSDIFENKGCCQWWSQQCTSLSLSQFMWCGESKLFAMQLLKNCEYNFVIRLCRYINIPLIQNDNVYFF